MRENTNGLSEKKTRISGTIWAGQISGFQNSRISGVAGYPVFRVAGYPVFRVARYPVFRVAGYLMKPVWCVKDDCTGYKISFRSNIWLNALNKKVNSN